MQMNVHAVGLSLTPALSQHAQERFLHALNQHDSRVAAVNVTLRDINGPRGGFDKEVDVTVRLVRGAVMVFKEIHTDMYAAISAAAERVKNTVGRRLARMKERRKSRD